MNLLGVSPYAFRMIVGFIILVAISMSGETLGFLSERLRRPRPPHNLTDGARK
ncbi:hypothetical protein [Paracoccus methylarcula]|uniref:hypothetical protein n=1 Tax=Paracoccus methylarcula TaxID=72022 RepID=UPI001FE352EF|nr:hypothetical protein [Paracoccus methylarcula]